MSVTCWRIIIVCSMRVPCRSERRLRLRLTTSAPRRLSKLSRYACQQYFRAYNGPSNGKKKTIHFFTRGSHIKISPWAIPTLQDDDAEDSRVRHAMSQRLRHDYVFIFGRDSGTSRVAVSQARCCQGTSEVYVRRVSCYEYLNSSPPPSLTPVM